MEIIMRAWHFVGKTLRDGSPVPADGVWLPVIADPVLCERGYHASVDAFDALKYAPGDVLCLVELRGTIVQGSDKVVASERMIVARFDAADMLRYFARMQALSVVDRWDAPQVVLDWLMTGDEKYRVEALEAAWASAASEGPLVGSVRAAAASWASGGTLVGSVRAASASWASWTAARAARTAARADFTALVEECFEGVL